MRASASAAPPPPLKTLRCLDLWDRIGATVLFITILTVLPGLTVLARREGAAKVRLSLRQRRRR